MEPTALPTAPSTDATPRAAADADARPAVEEAPRPERRLDLSRMEPPRRLEEARLEEVTIDGICGVY